VILLSSSLLKAPDEAILKPFLDSLLGRSKFGCIESSISILVEMLCQYIVLLVDSSVAVNVVGYVGALLHLTIPQKRSPGSYVALVVWRGYPMLR
jgi:hypothetical protein